MNHNLTPEQAEGMDSTIEYAQCTGPCDQGDRACPCPEACHRREHQGRSIPRAHWLHWAMEHRTEICVCIAIASAYWLAKN